MQKAKRASKGRARKVLMRRFMFLNVILLLVIILGLVQVLHECFHHLAGFGDELQGRGYLVFVG